MGRIRYFSLLAGSICLMAASSNAASLLSYQFSYAPEAADPIQPFDFSFLSSAFVNNNQTLNFRPYVVTDGTNSFTITQGITGSGCFNFGTSTTSISNCGGTVQPGGGGFVATFTAGLPTTLGSFTPSLFGGLFETSTTNETPTGSLTLKITEVQSPLLYRFTYTPGPADPIQAFAFSLYTQDFLADGTTLNFTPYAVTDGTNSFTITQGITGSGCFNFGTSNTPLSNCGGAVQPGGGGFVANFPAGLPTTLGSFTSPLFGGLFETSTTDETPTGSLTVDITAVPEPSTMLLFILGIAALIAFRRKLRA